MTRFVGFLRMYGYEHDCSNGQHTETDRRGDIPIRRRDAGERTETLPRRRM